MHLGTLHPPTHPTSWSRTPKHCPCLMTAQSCPPLTAVTPQPPLLPALHTHTQVAPCHPLLSCSHAHPVSDVTVGLLGEVVVYVLLASRRLRAALLLQQRYFNTDCHQLARALARALALTPPLPAPPPQAPPTAHHHTTPTSALAPTYACTSSGQYRLGHYRHSPLSLPSLLPPTRVSEVVRVSCEQIG
jgi:hypothetical protein